MYIQEHVRDLPDGLKHRDTDGNVGDEHAVHHVHMDVVRVGDAVDIPFQICKIGGEDGRRNFDHEKDLFSVVFRQRGRAGETGSVTGGPGGA